MNVLREYVGFSLIELLVVIILIAICSLLVFRSVNTPESRLKRAAFSLKGDMELAKMLAVKKNKKVAIIFSSYSYHIRPVGEETTKSVIFDPEMGDNSSRVFLTSHYNNNKLVFTQLGTCTAGHVKLVLNGYNLGMNVTTNGSGRISISSD